jgi:hypothetical protein
MVLTAGSVDLVMLAEHSPNSDLAAEKMLNSAYPLGLHNAGHADPRTTLAYIRSQERLSKSPTYVLRY